MDKFKTFIKTFMFLISEDKKQLPLVMFLFVLSSFLDILGLGLIAPYISLILGEIDVSNISILNFLDLDLTLANLVPFFGVAIVTIFSLKFAMATYIHNKVVSFSQTIQAKLSVRLMKTYQFSDYEALLGRNSSEYIYNIQTLCVQFSQTVLSVLKFIGDFFITTTIIIFLALQDFSTLLYLIILLGGSVLLYDFFFKNKITKFGKLSNEHSTMMIKSVSEGFNSFKEIKILKKEDYFNMMLEFAANGHALNHTKAQVLSIIPRYGIEFLIIFFIVTFSSFTFYFNENMAVAYSTLAMFGVASMRLVPSANSLSSCSLQIRYGIDGMMRIRDDLNLFKNPIKKEKKSRQRFESIDLNRVSYHYPGTTKKILDKFSLSIKKGDFIGVIGESGSGKTTLIDVLLGLLKPSEGNILVNKKQNNHNVFFSNVAYIPQDSLLIDDTLEKNISLSSDECNKKNIMDAIRKADLEELLKSLPSGLSTRLGERGVNISGGQRQRVGIARAFFFDREIFILDESTSALDINTEKKIINQINKLKGKKTLIVISHRESVLELCDKIVNISQKDH